MKYSDKSADAQTIEEVNRLIEEHNVIAHSNKQNSCRSYDHDKVIDFLSEDSDAIDRLIEESVPSLLMERVGDASGSSAYAGSAPVEPVHSL